ncbi:MAG: GntR family transcriptional regulator [Tissierellia bacterium]|nr:GntR family transcriptional regulator [Tissierellia bacterium]
MKKDNIYDTLKSDILNLKYLPDSKIKEIEISEKFNISRTPVRESFKKLEQDGLILIKPKIATRVSKINLKRLFDRLYIRASIESRVFSEVRNTIDELNSFKLKLEIQKQEKLLKANDVIAFLEADDNFHRLIYSFISKESIWDFLQQNNYDYYRFRMFLLKFNKLHHEFTLDEHKNLVDLLLDVKKGDLIKSVENHVYKGVKSSNELISKYENMFISN